MEEFETKLIVEVEAYPCIYNKKCSDYRNKSRKQESWYQISQVVGMPVIDCQRKWANLRDAFTRLYKHELHNSSSSDIKWKHYNNLKFLSEFTQNRLSDKDSNGMVDVDPLPDDQFIKYYESEPTTEKHHLDIKAQGERKLDELTAVKESSSFESLSQASSMELFFMSLARQTAQLSKKQLLQFQMKCLLALKEVEFPDEMCTASKLKL